MSTAFRLAIAAVLLSASTGFATAQTVVISPEQETVIHEYVTTHEVAPVELPSDYDLTVGAVLPSDIELHAIKAPDLDARYEYVVVGNQTVLVEPDTRKVIKIIE